MAGTNLIVLEKAKVTYLKTAGNLIEMSRILNIEIEEAKKMVAEFKKAESENVKVLIANHLMQLVIFGSEGRKARFMEMLSSLDKTEKPKLSICCNAPFRTIDTGESSPTTYQCLKCNAPCEVRGVPKASIYTIKINIEEQLRKEDETLVNMAEKMGYVNAKEGPNVVNNVRQNILVVEGEGKDKQIFKDYSKLNPMDRERLMEKLRKEIVTIDEQIETKETQSPDTLS